MHNSQRGKKGEDLAADTLVKNGMEIITRNYRSKYGEIDIIALDSGIIVFVEVKAWLVFGLEDLQYSINTGKQRKIIKTAKYFLLENRKYSNMPIRFDVVFISNNSVTHLASAFMERV